MTRQTLTYGRRRQTGVNWITVVAMAAFHLGAVGALFYVDAGAILAMVILWIVSGMLGIGMGYHRLLTHRGYQTYKWLEYFLALCGTLALEGGPLFWVATHRIHHQWSDRDGDPHSPRDGTYWAHMGWIMAGPGLHASSVLARYAPDLARDRFHVAMSRWHWVSNVAVGLVLFAVGGVPYVLWGVFFRTTCVLHSTWLVNSAAHLWGRRRFKTRDDSTNNWWVALLTFGEGWHNNHHAHPTSVRHGLAWYELDLNWLGVSLLERVGLAWNLRLARIAQAMTEDQILPRDDAVA